MRGFSQALRLGVIALASLTWMSASSGEQVLKLTPGFAKSVTVDGAAAGKVTSIIGDPKVADVTFGPKNTFWFVGLIPGATNIIVLNNDTGNEVYSARIEVDDVTQNRVHIHNKKLLTSYTTYECAPDCAYLGEVTATEPAPLPRGHLQSSSQYNSWIQSNTAAPPSVPPNPASRAVI